MRLEILGSGGAVTIPRPGCDCRVCAEARARGIPYARTGPSVFVHGPDVLIDTPQSEVAAAAPRGTRPKWGSRSKVMATWPPHACSTAASASCGWRRTIDA